MSSSSQINPHSLVPVSTGKESKQLSDKEKQNDIDNNNDSKRTIARRTSMASVLAKTNNNKETNIDPDGNFSRNQGHYETVMINGPNGKEIVTIKLVAIA